MDAIDEFQKLRNIDLETLNVIGLELTFLTPSEFAKVSAATLHVMDKLSIEFNNLSKDLNERFNNQMKSLEGLYVQIQKYEGEVSKLREELVAEKRKRLIRIIKDVE